MVKHNNVIPNGHFKKHWQNYVKTWFNQPARKQRRRIGELIAPPGFQPTCNISRAWIPISGYLQYFACMNSN